MYFTIFTGIRTKIAKCIVFRFIRLLDNECTILSYRCALLHLLNSLFYTISYCITKITTQVMQDFLFGPSQVFISFVYHVSLLFLLNFDSHCSRRIYYCTSVSFINTTHLCVSGRIVLIIRSVCEFD